MRIVAVCLALLSSCAVANASERVLAEVTQPIGGSGEGILLANVSYVDWFNRELDPWPSVRLTTAPNSILTERGAQDLNRASELGVKVSLRGAPSGDPSRPQGLRGDTLEVSLAVPALTNGAPGSRELLRQVAVATLQCILVNASRYSPRLQFVDVQCSDNAEYADLSGIYPLESIPRPWTPRLPEDLLPMHRK